MDLPVHAWTLFTRGHDPWSNSFKGKLWKSLNKNSREVLLTSNALFTGVWGIILEEEAKPDHEANSVAEC